jgi:hypothetical protein
MPEPEREFVIYNGVRVVAGWPERIEEAQTIPTISICGAVYPRIRYGDEPGDWGADRQGCRDCGVIKRQFHVPSCDVECCPRCGGQAITCDCPYDDEDQDSE